MKRVLLTVLLVGLLAGQASASMYNLTDTVANQFRQLNVADPFSNQLYVVIDTPGTLGSTIQWQVSPLKNTYGDVMQMDVGFVGQLDASQIMTIGKVGALPGAYDQFGSYIANDDDDKWSANLYVKVGATTYQSGMTAIAPNSSLFLSTPTFAGTVTEFGFEVDYQGANGSDNFHVSVVPIPAALILGLLGMGAAGLKLRRFA